MIYRMLAIVVIAILLQSCKTSDPYKNFKKEIRTKKIKDYDNDRRITKKAHYRTFQHRVKAGNGTQEERRI
jgi:lipoprotein